MNFQWVKISLLSIFLLAITSISFGQKKNDLQDEYKQLLSEIADLESLIAETASQKDLSLSQLQAINAKIESRQDLMSNIKGQVSFVAQSILQKTEAIKAMEEDITALKTAYATMIYNSYKSMYLKNQISFIFSAESFNQAMNRFNYLRSYAAHRENQAELISKTIQDLENTISTLENQRNEKAALLAEEIAQEELLLQEKAAADSLLTQLNEDEEKLKKQAQQKNTDAQALNTQIQKIIEEEIRLAKEKAAAEAAANNTTTTTNTSNTLALTPAEQALSNDFINNKGKLPWPVVKGHIVEKFGEHPHPTLTNVKTYNNGVDIQTENDAAVRAVFGGTVVNTFYLAATQNTILVKHGEYYSVYSNLKTVNVSAGEVIATKQSIGTAFTSESEGIAKVHLEIWKGTTKSNPALWLAQ